MNKVRNLSIGSQQRTKYSSFSHTVGNLPWDLHGRVVGRHALLQWFGVAYQSARVRSSVQTRFYFFLFYLWPSHFPFSIFPRSNRTTCCCLHTLSKYCLDRLIYFQPALNIFVGTLQLKIDWNDYPLRGFSLAVQHYLFKSLCHTQNTKPMYRSQFSSQPFRTSRNLPVHFPPQPLSSLLQTLQYKIDRALCSLRDQGQNVFTLDFLLHLFLFYGVRAIICC